MPGKRRAEQHTKVAARDDWCSPWIIANLVREHFDGPVGIDPAADPKQVVDAHGYILLDEAKAAAMSSIVVEDDFVLNDNGLYVPWHQYKDAYFNPPYGRGVNGAWSMKAYEESLLGTEIIGLVPSSPGAVWWDPYWAAKKICFWRGRLKFIGAPLDARGKPNSADFESAIVYYGELGRRFERIFSPYGRVIDGDRGRWLKRNVGARKAQFERGTLADVFSREEN